MDILLKKIVFDINHGLLGYKWEIRKYLSIHPNNSLNIALDALANSSFKQTKNISNNNDDITTKAVMSLCSDPVMVKNGVDGEDSEVKKMSTMFNKMINSKRKLHKCYDCGTLARAMFLKIIQDHKNKKHFITRNDWINIKRTYVPRIPSESLGQWFEKLTKTNEDLVMICSLGFNKFGHVFIIEKKWSINDGEFIYRIFQSAYKNYLVLDYLEFSNGNFNPYELGRDLTKLLTRHKWTTTTRMIFWKWFCFDPKVKIEESDVTKFCYACVTLN